MIHHVFANKSNIGDWLSALGIQRLLAPHAFTEYFCDEPFVAETLAALRAAGPEDLIIIGGGGLLMDYFEPFWRGIAELARECRFVIWGIGCCHDKKENTQLDRDLAREVVGRAQAVLVRDEVTRDFLAPLDLPPPVACPAHSYIDLEPLPTRPGVLHVDNYTTVGAQGFEVMSEAARSFAWETGREYHRTNNRIEHARAAELESVLDNYRASDVVLSSGLHGCVIAVAMGRKLACVSGDVKLDAYMAQAGLGDWLVGWDRAGEAVTLLDRIDRQPPVTAFVAATRNANARYAAEVRDLIHYRRKSA